VLFGFHDEWFDARIGAFNGDINEVGDDDQIDKLVASARVTLPEEETSKFGLMGGVSWISDISESEVMQDLVVGSEVRDYVAGFHAFVSASYKERYFFEGEYVTALDYFEVGELDPGTLGSGQKKPKAWNLELAFAPTDRLELGVKYEGSDEFGEGADGDGFPEKQYGAVVTYMLFESTAISLEYLHGEFENDDERDLFTTQLGLEF
jgi:hypothetical protein